MRGHQQPWYITIPKWIAHRVAVILGAALLAGALFLVLPILERISSSDEDMRLLGVDSVALPPPPPPVDQPEPEKPPEEKPQEEPPPTLDEAPPMDLAQLELALGGGGIGGPGVAAFAADLSVKVVTEGGKGEDNDALFSIADLDQKPRVLHQTAPRMTPALRKSAPATVSIIFIVGEDGRVENPIVQSSTNAEFDSSALAAVRQWRFEPGRRNGEAVRFRMRVPITFPRTRS